MSAQMSGLTATEKVQALATAPHVTQIMRDCIAELVAEHADLLAALTEFMDACAYAEPEVLRSAIAKAYTLGRAAIEKAEGKI